MTERNLISEFSALRDGFNARRRPRRRLYKQDNDFMLNDLEVEAQMPLSPNEQIGISQMQTPKFIIAGETIRNIIDFEIKQKIKTLKQLHKNRLMVRFDNSEQAKDREIDILTHEVTDLFRNAESKIKKELVTSGGKTTNIEEMIKDNLKRQLASDLQELSSEFRKSQKKYLDKLRIQKGDSSSDGMSDILGLTNNHAQNLFKETSGGGFLEQQLMTEQLEQEKGRSEIMQRDQEIQKIAESINELATIFSDLSTLVIEQGTILDRIDYNLENVQIKTQHGLEELKIADKYSENSRPFKCIMFLVGLIVVEAFFLMIRNS